MKRILISCFLLTVACLHKRATAQESAGYQPLHAEKWQQVVNYAHAQWAAQEGRSRVLPLPYLTAWSRLPHMFYWDTHFINEGLLLAPNGLDSFARNNVTNLLFAVDSFGFVGNAVVTAWGMNRSQPPYLSAMVRSYYEKKGRGDTAFLRRAYFSLLKEYRFWTDAIPNRLEDHGTPMPGLQRYSHHATREELVELYRVVAERFHLPVDIPEEEKIKVAILFAVEAGTGMDFTPRFEDRCPDFAAVDLNALLYVYEENFAWMKSILGLKGESDWEKLAAQRRQQINRYCWSEARGLFLDYDFINKRHSKVAAVTAFQPMWAGMASSGQAAALVSNLPLFETPYGVVTTEATGSNKRYQWGEGSIWPPMQLLMVQALDRYGYKAEARRIAMKYLDLVTAHFLDPRPARAVGKKGPVFRKPGAAYEKYTRDGLINDDEYLAREMMGWATGAFLWLYDYVIKK